MGSVTGTTVNAYANALEWVCYSFDKNTIIVKNTDGSNALKFKVLGLAEASGIEAPIEIDTDVTEKVLSTGAIQIVAITTIYHSLYVALKSNVGGAHATYQVDYIGGLQR